jgi:hypothetical protein
MTSLNVPSNLPISVYLLKQCKLWIWDFDDTLIDTATYMNANMTPDAIRNRTDAELDRQVPQWRYFRRLIEYLVEHGRYVGIASFGTYEIIQAYMDRIMGFNQKFFTKMNIIAPDFSQRNIAKGGFTRPSNKNEYIYTLMRIYRVQDFKRSVLFDDDPSNIADAIAIGVIGIQIATPRNGDTQNIYFGPWVMSRFDREITAKCTPNLGRDPTAPTNVADIYLNRATYSGIVSKENYTGNAFTGNDIDFGTGFDTDNPLGIDYQLGIIDAMFNKNKEALRQTGPTPAFGSGIGDRKVNGVPQFRWNTTTAGAKVPRWANGNYENIPGMVETPGYWNPASLGGNTISFWDKYQSAGNPKTESKSDIPNPDKIIIPRENKNTTTNLEHFENPNATCNTVYPKWLILLLMVIIVFMVILLVKHC